MKIQEGAKRKSFQSMSIQFPPFENMPLDCTIALSINTHDCYPMAILTTNFAHIALHWMIGFIIPKPPQSLGLATSSHLPQCKGFH